MPAEEGGPAPRVIYIAQQPPAGAKRTFKPTAGKTVTLLGSLHLLCGLLLLGTTITTTIPVWLVPGYGLSGVVFSVLFLVSGGLAVLAACKPSKSLLVIALVMEILAAVCAAILLIMASAGLTSVSHYCMHYNGRSREEGCNAKPILGLHLAISLAMLVASLSNSALSCAPLCCQPGLPAGAMHYIAGQAGPPAEEEEEQGATANLFGELGPRCGQKEGDTSKYHRLV
jgi:hypothetical protein